MGRAPNRQSFDAQAFAQDVYAAAQRKGLSIGELERRVGVSQTFVVRIRLYNRRPNVDAFLNICAACGLDPMAYRLPDATTRPAPCNSVFSLATGLQP